MAGLRRRKLLARARRERAQAGEKQAKEGQMEGSAQRDEAKITATEEICRPTKGTKPAAKFASLLKMKFHGYSHGSRQGMLGST